MVLYTVLWSRAAEGELARLWAESENRQDITRATNRIDEELRMDAHRKGLPLPKKVRSFSYAPLIVYFQIDEADRKVFVEGVQLTEVN